MEARCDRAREERRAEAQESEHEAKRRLKERLVAEGEQRQGGGRAR